MAKKRKVGGVYKAGLFSIKKYSGRDEEAYLKRLYDLNKQLFDSAYDEARAIMRKEKDVRAAARFDKAYPNIQTWIKKTVQNTIRTSEEGTTFNKGVTEAIRLSFTSASMRFKENIISGMKSFGIYDEFMLYINETFNLNRLNYADGAYIYVTERGTKVAIDPKDSPYTLELRVIGERVNG